MSATTLPVLSMVPSLTSHGTYHVADMSTRTRRLNNDGNLLDTIWGRVGDMPADMSPTCLSDNVCCVICTLFQTQKTPTYPSKQTHKTLMLAHNQLPRKEQSCRVPHSWGRDRPRPVRARWRDDDDACLQSGQERGRGGGRATGGMRSLVWGIVDDIPWGRR